MTFIYPFLTTFMLIFLSELGDKTQLLVLSYSTKNKAKNIFLGVALGSFLSHGLAILFGSKLASFENPYFQFYLQLFTYSSFIVMGVLGFLPSSSKNDSHKSSFLEKLSLYKLHYIFIIAFNIFIGEIGDKTFLAALGMGLQYSDYKLFLILGSILGMVTSNCIAIFFGKFLSKMISQKVLEILSNFLFIIFGLLGFISILF